MAMDQIQKRLLEEVADLHDIPEGAYNIRANGETAVRNTTANIDIISKEDGTGIDIKVKDGTKKESIHIPVVLSKSGLKEVVYNDFYIGEDCDVFIVAGCGIHNCGVDTSKHDGVHTFYIGKNAKVKYVERHYGEGDGNGENIMNPETIIHLEEGAYLEMETTQIKGIDSTNRITRGDLAAGATLEVREKLMTHGKQYARTDFSVDLNGDGCSANIVSRSVAREQSRQEFFSNINGNSVCSGHSECDAIIMDQAVVAASPQLTAANIDASLIHEAAIGRINDEQLTKLRTLGMTAEEAESVIVEAFLN